MENDFRIKSVKVQNIELNRICRKFDEVYHEYAARCGISDASFWVLYTLCESDDIYTQNDLEGMWCFPKQTVNFAISKLVKDGFIRLEQIAAARNSKAVRLTEKGMELCGRIIVPVIEAEQRSLMGMSVQERELLISLSRKQYDNFKSEIEKCVNNIK